MTYTVRPSGPVSGVLRPPGSKSITNRALLLAALAPGTSRLIGGLDSIDTRVMRESLARLGVQTEGSDDWVVHGTGGRLRAGQTLFCQNSGTTLRFLTGAAALASGATVLDGDEHMRRRPIQHLVDALGSMGADITSTDGRPPVRCSGGRLDGGTVRMDASVSSQFVSAVLMVAPFADDDVHIEFIGGEVVSKPYIDLTLATMADFGVDAGWTREGRLFVRSGQTYRPRTVHIEPDASSAAYLFGMAAITRGTVTVPGVGRASLQADYRLLDVLRHMGCTVQWSGDDVTVSGPARLRSAGTRDLNDFPDASLALAVIALFADGPCTLTGIGNLRVKETDRLFALETEIRRLGAHAETGPDWIRIVPGPLRPAQIQTYVDHRMAMSFAMAGLVQPGIEILDPSCVDKTWPGFFTCLERLSSKDTP